MGTSAGGEGQEYEEVDVGVGGVGASDPIPTWSLEMDLPTQGE
jgi:hypothetical protein